MTETDSEIAAPARARPPRWTGPSAVALGGVLAAGVAGSASAVGHEPVATPLALVLFAAVAPLAVAVAVVAAHEARAGIAPLREALRCVERARREFESHPQTPGSHGPAVRRGVPRTEREGATP